MSTTHSHKRKQSTRRTSVIQLVNTGLTANRIVLPLFASASVFGENERVNTRGWNKVTSLFVEILEFAPPEWLLAFGVLVNPDANK